MMLRSLLERLREPFYGLPHWERWGIHVSIWIVLIALLIAFLVVGLYLISDEGIGARRCRGECKTRTRRFHPKHPTLCVRCGARAELEAQARAEEIWPCAAHGLPMQKALYGRVIFNQCPDGCFFFSPGGLQTLVKQIQDDLGHMAPERFVTQVRAETAIAV